MHMNNEWYIKCSKHYECWSWLLLLLQQQKWNFDTFMVLIIKKKLTFFCSNKKWITRNEMSSQNILSNENSIFSKC